MHRGRHLLVDCRNVSREICLDDKGLLEIMARAAEKAGATVISQIRYRFGEESPPGFAAVVLLDESHCSAHSYADLGLLAIDIFTCGQTDPRDLLRNICEEVSLGDLTVLEVKRFEAEDGSGRLRTVKGVTV